MTTIEQPSVEFPSPAWWEALRGGLERHTEWNAAARWLSARVALRSEGHETVLDVRDGTVAAISTGAPLRGAEIVLSATDREWRRVVAGETDLFQAMSPGLGELTLEGDIVEAMRNIKALALLLNAMAEVGGTRPKPAPSPPIRATGATISGRYVTVDGIRTYYEQAGSGRPLVCFHAACQDTLMYRHVLDGLADAFTVTAIDAPGHAKSSPPADGPFTTLTEHAAFSERALEHLGIERPAILGCSMGGNLVLELAARRPDGYAAVISCEGADHTPTVAQFTLDMLHVNGQQIIECFARSLTGDRTPPDRRADVLWQIRRVPPEVMAGDLVGYAGFDKRAEVSRITAPVLLLRGDADWLVSQEQIEATSARIPGSRIVVLEGTGHYPMTENPQEFNDAVRAFLA